MFKFDQEEVEYNFVVLLESRALHHTRQEYDKAERESYMILTMKGIFHALRGIYLEQTENEYIITIDDKKEMFGSYLDMHRRLEEIIKERGND